MECVFQPVFGLGTGNVVAIAMGARPRSATLHETLLAARRRGELTGTDIALVRLAAKTFASSHLALPVHLDVLAVTVAWAPTFAGEVAAELEAVGLSAERVAVELKPPFSGIDKQALASGVQSLRAAGFQVGLAGLGEGDIPFAALTELKPDFAKIDPTVVAGLADDPARVACVEALALFCTRLSTRLVAEGVTEQAQLAVLKKYGVSAAQGELLAAATAHAPPPDLDIEQMLAGLPGSGWAPSQAGPSLVAADLAQPAVTMPDTSTAEDVRRTFSEHADAGSVVLLDGTEKVTCFVDRNRFLMAVTGAYGHALYAKRQVTHLAESPVTVGVRASPLELLELISAAPRHQNNDDLVVVDDHGRCAGVVSVSEAMRAMADLRIQHAARLHPLTGLPGTEAITGDVSQRIQRQQAFAVSWLDIDQFKAVNDSIGFAAGDQLIKLIGQSLQATTMNRPNATIAHVGGDDFLLVADLDDVLPLIATVLDSPVTVERTTPTLSVATLICAPASIDSYQYASRLLAPLKHSAKGLAGTSWVAGRPGTDKIDVLRGTPSRQAQPRRRPGEARHWR